MFESIIFSKKSTPLIFKFLKKSCSTEITSQLTLKILLSRNLEISGCPDLNTKADVQMCVRKRSWSKGTFVVFFQNIIPRPFLNGSLLSSFNHFLMNYNQWQLTMYQYNESVFQFCGCCSYCLCSLTASLSFSCFFLF